MNQIAGTSGDRCLDRAISTMRLALGYKTGLPDTMPKLGQRHISQVVCALPIFFPDHRVKVWCTAKDYTEAPNLTHQGEESRGGQDDLLMAFAYRVNENEEHIVVGEPAGDLSVSLIFGVELGDKNV